MYRPAQTFALVIAAIVVALTSCVSYVVPLGVTVQVTDRNCVVVHWFDGRMRAFWIESPGDAIRVVLGPENSAPLLDVVSAWPDDADGDTMMAPGRPGRPDGPALRARIRISSRRDVPAFAFQWPWQGIPQNPNLPPVAIRFVRFPMWAPGLLLLIPAAIAVHRGPRLQRHRRERGLCPACGYDLRGLPEPRCPECGGAIPPVECQTPVTLPGTPDRIREGAADGRANG